LVWTEVGSGDLSATLTSGSYLGSGLSATGTTGTAGAVGRFKPHHFDVAVTQACSAGAFTYAGQPAQVTITARNGLATPGTTVNYDGSAATSPNQAQSLLLSEATSLGLGSLSGTAVSASAFLAGVATAAPSYTYTTKTTGPRALALRAIDADGVSSLGYLEGSVNLRSGRLRLPNAFGSSSQALRMPVMAEYWTGQAWLLNSADSCTTLPAAAVAVSNARNHLGNTSTATTLASAVTLSGGNGVLTLAAPTPAASVSFDVALNLGATAADQSCNAAHPATAPGARAWLRAANGSCAVTADRDPASRASFGLYAPETRKTVHARELF
jgi:MSHA biogenesis protein MshQ